MCGGVFLSARSQCVRPGSPGLRRFFSAPLSGAPLALCAAAGCGGSLRSNQSPPLAPPPGGLRGLPEEMKGIPHAYRPPQHYIGKKEKNRTYILYIGAFPPYVQSIAQKKPYMSRASTAWGLSPPLDIGFFCTLALIRGKSPSLSVPARLFQGVTY